MTRSVAVAAATTTLVCSAGLSLPAHAAPTTTPSTVPTAPVTQATNKRVAVPTASGSVTVGTTTYQLLAQLDAPASFDLAGLTWTGLKGKPTLQVRALTASGWSEWSDASPDAAGTGAGGSDAIYTSAATRVQVRAFGPAGASVSGLKVSLIDSNATSADQQVVAAATAARTNATIATASAYTYATQPTIITRAQWGADESLLSTNGSSCVQPTYDQTIKAAVVHHTDGSNTYTQAQAASIVRGIYQFHVVDRGWCDIGYNFLVDKYGDIFEGRHGAMDLPVHGAHATYWNTNTVGISNMMNSETAAPTAAMLTSLEKVIAWKLAGNYVDPLAKVYLVNGTYNTILRHGDVMQTSCPGANITAKMSTIRTAVSSMMGNWKTPIYQAWQSLGGASGSMGVPHQQEEAYNGGRLTVFTKGAILQVPSSTGSLSTTTVWMNSTLWAKYTALGGAAKLGFPVASQTSGTISGTTSITLANGQAIVSTASGTYLTTAAIKAVWWNNATVNASLGNPVADAVTTSTGSYQLFQRGRVDVVNGVAKVTYTATWGDQNGDGLADLTTLSSGATNLTFRLTQGGTAGTSLAGPTVDSGTNWVAQVPDLNSDGHGELVTRSSDGTMWVALGRGNGTFSTRFVAGRGWGGLRELTISPDMNRDGLPELLALDAQNNLRRYWFTTSGSLTGGTVLASGWSSVTRVAAAGDYTGDGALDLLTVSTDGSLKVWPGTTSGTLKGTSTQIGHGWGAFTQVWSMGDVTGDKRPDLMARTSTGAVLAYALKVNSIQGAGTYLSSTSGLSLVG